MYSNTFSHHGIHRLSQHTRSNSVSQQNGTQESPSLDLGTRSAQSCLCAESSAATFQAPALVVSECSAAMYAPTGRDAKRENRGIRRRGVGTEKSGIERSDVGNVKSSKRRGYVGV